ncbi:ABC transporter ATP-binding protein [Desulfobacter postgatei]|uniref:ABC transporter ATP-binding protein n=1 Tax=Desulfobacter postgatei TaxID=2293 RepID=UPI00259BB3AB|nr:ABC transporter ATP-binding protein [uncultured Desulfobacter sp.]
MRDELIIVENLGKKFCRSLKRSLWYGLRDIASELTGHGKRTKELRKDEFWAVQDISFTVKKGETIGLIGRNGAGKTTLLRMLNGLIKPDKGTIHIRGRMQALIALGAGFNPILTGRENIYVNASVLGISKKEIDQKLDEIIAFSGIEEFMDTPVQNYSSGMAVRLGFAVAAHLDPDILLVDEVLAVGDEGFQSKCLNKIGELKKKGAAILLVSHNMHTISTFSNEVIMLNKGGIEIFDNISKGIAAYRRLFSNNDGEDIQKICNGNDNIIFDKIEVSNQEMVPGESFSISMRYNAQTEYFDAEIDTAIYSSNESGHHFQATNKAYDRVINLKKGVRELRITINDIKINNATAKIGLAIWSCNREELLFWWRIPVQFGSKHHAIGNNFLNVSYDFF